ncbi:hypothetical protein [Sandaracinus amylolyticus]|uniref:YokE-like PH domain-containing protein n=1 Tax=Sandaracinus amylolyticus TaxID=927083 RepID=A0A0F6YHZ1_9BACT|nr:hypothetical protein [Sandaracinus amylolyticus]AKF05338.1 hypothetical protein DB32_002487 [Sandaracinus amylolyticus]
MAIFFSDLYVDTLSKALLAPGERLVARASGLDVPWWSMGIPMLASHYLVLVTNQRAVLVRHKRGWVTGDRMEEVKSVAWSQVQQLKVSGLFAKKKLTLEAGEVRLSLAVRGGFLEIPGNLDAAKQAVDTWQQSKALPASTASYARAS